MKRRPMPTLCLTAAALLSVLLICDSVTAAPRRVVPHGEYQSLIRECRRFLGQREINPAAAKTLALRLRNIGSVTLPTGQTVVVDTKPEADALDAITGTTPDKKLGQRFAVLAEQLAVASAAPGNDPHRVAEQVLKAGEFRESRPEDPAGNGWDWSFLPRWMRPVEKVLKPVIKSVGDGFTAFGKWLGKGVENLFRAIGRFFRWIFNKFPQGKNKWNAKNPFASLGNGVLLTLYFLATVGAVVGVYFLSRYLFDLYEVKTGRKRRPGSALGGDLDLSEEGITDPLTTARDRAGKGDYRSAIRLTYIASLWKLGEGGILTLEKNRTNWEYQRALRKVSRPVHDDLLPATRLFDRVWYGKQPGSAQEYEMVSAIYDRLPDALAATDGTRVVSDPNTVPASSTAGETPPREGADE